MRICSVVFFLKKSFIASPHLEKMLPALSVHPSNRYNIVASADCGFLDSTCFSSC